MKEEILQHLSAEYPWKDQFHFYPALDSTHDRLKAMARQGAPHGTVVMAGSQTGGHGRMGRTFHSPEGMGIYMNILLRPRCTPMELMHLTCATGVAMCDAVEASAGFRPGIKWTNDLVFEKRKLGGILTELGITPKGELSYALIGIGINCCQQLEDFAPDIRNIAGSLSMVTGREIDRNKVAAAMMEALYQMEAHLLTDKAVILEQYRTDCITVGQEISILRGDSVRHGTALSVDDEGALVVRYTDGSVESVNSGEVSIRGMYGYL